MSPGLVASVVADEPERFTRIWRVIQPLYEDYATSASLKQIADVAGLSLRQLGRDLTELTRTFDSSVTPAICGVRIRFGTP